MQPSTFLGCGGRKWGRGSQRWVPILMAASVLFWDENQGVPNDSKCLLKMILLRFLKLKVIALVFL